ncbi:MAG: lipid II:glycine glycyltransferase FemX [Candidatus Hodarchaeota archaeon]
MRALDAGYTTEIDTVDKCSWFEILKQFDDTNIYQTWSYHAIRCGERNIGHFLLKKNGTIVAAAQARIFKVPVVNLGIAYIRWGPLWRLHNEEPETENFRLAVRGLRIEYVCRRGLVLRLLPQLFEDDSNSFRPMLQQEGYIWPTEGKRDRTLIIDLRRSLEDLRKGLKQKWRNCLNHAEKDHLEIIEGHDVDLFDIFIQIYRQMLERKKFPEPNDINEFKLIQKDLPERFKMKVFICRSHDEPTAGAICSAIGDTGIYLFGATNEAGMKNKGSYLLQWRIIEWLKERKCHYYDLNGIDPDINPGTYRFKAGLCGRNGRDVDFLGQFDSYKNSFGRFWIGSGDMLRMMYRKAKNPRLKISRII